MSQAWIEEIAWADPATRAACLAGQPGFCWLDSGRDSAGPGRFDILAAWPERVLHGYIDEGHQLRLAAGSNAPADALDQGLFAALSRLAPPGGIENSAGLPFIGGLIGYLGYDLNAHLERLPLPPTRATPAPDFHVGYYPCALVQDRVERRAWLVADSATGRAQLTRLRAALAGSGAAPPAVGFRLAGQFRSNFSRTAYCATVARAQDYIAAGDCYQVNFAQCFSAPYKGCSWAAYLQVRNALSAPFSAFIATGAGDLLCFSPERFLQVTGDRVETRPIKGTRPRGATTASDRELAQDLLASAKDRAENLMIVDLMRNDLGRCCMPGSIVVERLFELESFTHVHHMVSTISGRLRPALGALDALAAAFPGGSVTGAPKIRAMEVIAELERLRRSAYCGSVFYLSRDGRMDSNIAIRSVVADATHLHCWGGGGIVADSDPDAEYEESLAKIRGILAALGPTDDACPP